MRTSDHLIPGQTYSREQLRERFQIADATINTDHLSKSCVM
ncbi:MAG: hypothetical protein ACK5Q8_09680 [Phycisphaerales bacterium]|jgi:hypothetical protein